MKHWTTKEIAIVREHYPRGGIDACAPLLPLRTRSSIYNHAGQLRLRAPGQNNVRQSWPKDAEIDERLRWLHQRVPQKGAVLEFAQRIGRPAWWVSRRARELGLITPRFKEAIWSKEEIDLLHLTAHIGTAAARQQFLRAGFNRSETSIHVKRKRERISAVQSRQDAGMFHAHEIASLFGVDGKTVGRWIRIDGLRAKQDREFLIIRQNDLRDFIIAHPLRIDLRKIPDSNRVWFIELLAGRAGVTVEQAA